MMFSFENMLVEYAQLRQPEARFRAEWLYPVS